MDAGPQREAQEAIQRPVRDRVARAVVAGLVQGDQRPHPEGDEGRHAALRQD